MVELRTQRERLEDLELAKALLLTDRLLGNERQNIEQAFEKRRQEILNESLSPSQEE